MLETEKPYESGKQILKLLHEHGALSNRGILRTIWPRVVCSSSIRQSVRLLKYKGLIVDRFDSLPQNCGQFHQISLREETKPIIAKMLNVHPAELEERVVRDQELAHSQECAVWCTRFRRDFPEATVLREHHYVKEEEFKNILVLGRDDNHLKPDILMHFPKQNGRSSTTVAVEVERSRKADARLVEKLRKLSTQSCLDGVIYICSTASLLETVRRLYESRVRERAHRINHYGDNFFLFSTGQLSVDHWAPVMLNSELKPISFLDWIHFLRTTSDDGRQEANLKLLPNT